MDNQSNTYYENNYLPFVIRTGKIINLLSIPVIFIPAVVLYFFYGLAPNWQGVLTGGVAMILAMLAWYIVDPITMYPVLQIPGMYITYLTGNSKEIRAPAAMAALNSTGIEPGTHQAAVISTIAISVSAFISIGVLTIIAVAGQYILSILPPIVIKALNYLLPAMFGAMLMQNVRNNYKVAAIVIPIVLVLRILNLNGVFEVLPLGGEYAQILGSVIIGTMVAKRVFERGR